MIVFDMPLAFLLLIAIPVILFFHFRKKRAGVRFSSVKNAGRAGVSLRQRLSIIPLILRLLALAALTVAIARPQEGKEQVRDKSKGVAIEMVMDHSSSMSLVRKSGGRTMSRLDIAKEAFAEFVSGNKNDLEGRFQDLIGMVTFARYPDTSCPLTLAHGALLKFNENIKTVIPGSGEDGTSIGDGVALAAARLRTAEATLAEQLQGEESDYQIKSKVIILLTDGEDTGIGKRSPLQAAELAKEWGIRIYTIGITGENWYQQVEDAFGRTVLQPVRTGYFDTSVLERMAETTGGITRTAQDIDSLRDVYREIDAMEKSEIESLRYLDYRELFLPFVFLALFFLAAEAALSATVFRRIP